MVLKCFNCVIYLVTNHYFPINILTSNKYVNIVYICNYYSQISFCFSDITKSKRQ